MGFRRQLLSRNIIKVLDKGFSDISAGDKMLISSPEKIADFIYAIPKGSFFTIKELRRGLALKAGADNDMSSNNWDISENGDRTE